MINFNKPPVTGAEQGYIIEAINSPKLSGDGHFGKRCQSWFEEKLGCKKALLTPSCTAALEMAAILFDIQPGDEVIMPSYTFVSTANAFVLRGAKIIFVDIRKDTMNIDETKIEAAITDRTKVLVPVHYAGVGCEMEKIMDLANKYGLFVVEDAAQGMMSTYKNRPLGTFGHLGAFSFHETKNYTSGGEGGLLIINDEKLAQRAEIIREKGTNRSLFFRGMVDKYSWVDIGSSFLPSELQSAYLWAQLEHAEKINEKRLSLWSHYKDQLEPLVKKGCIEAPSIPMNCKHNAHMFYIKVKRLKQRTMLLNFLKSQGVMAVFHYIPLHNAEAGKKYSKFIGKDENTTSESERLIRLPLYFNMTHDEVIKVSNAVTTFFE
ncbi:dTDP-4-amino-4,6-dideoxygalactose transaminase [Oceanimonas doudoroffii]|uniref:dTDP-4-amino-4,6-dideoxygalactose transaminase n=1 Tax=Oceanimonas doudoroffii TaxID=84158 RepID=A0A233RFD8_9GAMM|nr:dTDP-4-amino-4,6-dideoxygalactose transaminase [Oceanimonas doudoroffii]OXY82110.1 dTDP-4-amino-4,6-dideoxygalactose transaminase [Oceanimonas doudoroffii]